MHLHRWRILFGSELVCNDCERVGVRCHVCNGKGVIAFGDFDDTFCDECGGSGVVELPERCQRKSPAPRQGKGE